jgi:presenilin-like A22 family membrane protease
MKDYTLTAKRQKKELSILLYCFIVAFLLNIAAIIIYKTPWVEVVTQIGYVVVVGVVLYGLLLLFRLIIASVKALLTRRKKH